MACLPVFRLKLGDVPIKISSNKFIMRIGILFHVEKHPGFGIIDVQQSCRRNFRRITLFRVELCLDAAVSATWAAICPMALWM